MLALCSPLLDLSRPYVSRMLPQVSSMSPMLAHVGPMLALCWPNLALCWPYLAPTLALSVLCWPKLALSCPYVDPMFTYVGLGNANPHSSDRKGGGRDGVGRGWERGDDGVPRPGRRLGRHASITFGYQPKASGMDTGLGRCPAPG